jgi:phosphoribosyl 1,2-cyclic phosphate phosphodiesterase
MTNTVFTLLGTGSSGGVPRIGNDWGACDPANPRNRRLRCSMLIEKSAVSGEKTSVLIDTGPDMRQQLLASDVEYLDAVLLTHSHADHIFGLDDLRQLAIRHRQRVNVYMDETTSRVVMEPFSYCFNQAPDSSYPAICNEHRIHANVPLTISGAGGDIEITPFEVEHGDIPALGFRVGKLAYMPDVKTINKEPSRETLRGLDTLIIDALRYSSHLTHMNVDEALACIEHFAPTRAILTNMHNAIDYDTLNAELPAHIRGAYDGMKITASV